MQTIAISIDERYPDYVIDDEPDINPETGKPFWGWQIQVDESTAQRWRRVIAEYEAVQDEMDALTSSPLPGTAGTPGVSRLPTPGSKPQTGVV